MTGSNAINSLADDGLYLPTIKRHSLEKIRLHNRYADIFAAAMAKKWPQLAYVGLFAGAGRARLADSGEIIETSALAIHRQKVPFTHHIYVDHDRRCVDALQRRLRTTAASARATFIERDVNDCASEVVAALPSYSKGQGLLSFCFVDPFDLQLKFSTIRTLSRKKIDFLVLLMLGMDGLRNFSRYYNDRSSPRIGDFLDSPRWREEYAAIQGRGRPLRFLLHRFDERMVGLGYLSAMNEQVTVKAHGTGVVQYVLALYSKHQTGAKFWRETVRTLDAQLDLPSL
ncbi:MAG: three-Cys-motif partner protein TcmP [Gemmatimonadetes bacterium]|nr:three-Cys-motif partner protein TcmP [Gemmatimonadota bacterium]